MTRVYRLAEEFVEDATAWSGSHSGSSLLEDIIIPLLKRHEHLVIDVQGVRTISIYFIKQAFLPIGQVYGPEVVRRVTVYNSKEKECLATSVIKAHLRRGIDWPKYWAGEYTEELSCQKK